MASLAPKLNRQCLLAACRCIAEPSLTNRQLAGVARRLHSWRVGAPPLLVPANSCSGSTSRCESRAWDLARGTRTSGLTTYNKHIPISTTKTCTPSSTEPIINSIFEPVTGTWQYVVADAATFNAAIIDPVLDYSPTSRCITTTTADAVLALIAQKQYTITWILETHAHADHLTAASYLKNRLTHTQSQPPTIGIGSRIHQVQSIFGARYSLPPSDYHPLMFDHLFSDDEVFPISSSLFATALHLPGHTPDHMGYQFGTNIFCGDSLFHADVGTARCDFPGGSASQLYSSARRLLSFPDHVKIWTGHDYPPGTRGPEACMTVGMHRMENKHVRDGVDEMEFVKLRRERDRGLKAPRLLHQSLQMNVRAGKLPGKTEYGDRLWHLPVKVEGEW
ncbi:beta-lactamase-like protein [Cercophora newfieldiana]|uniref:Beta-lactamase-like protein n=1 Tax=Cercophora newfieldiana TaxID=92897 RepID=A0AA39YSB0_9PEZI|nr:beta-lactamase-like protein [Cercophora newfieldiana]